MKFMPRAKAKMKNEMRKCKNDSNKEAKKLKENKKVRNDKAFNARSQKQSSKGKRDVRMKQHHPKPISVV